MTNATRRATHSLVPRLSPLAPTKNKNGGGEPGNEARLHMVRMSVEFTGAFYVASELLWQNVSASKAFVS